MQPPETTTLFAGVDGRTNGGLPSWYARRTDGGEPVSFAEAIRGLPRAIETTVAYNDPRTGEWVPTDRFNALVDPAKTHNQEHQEATEEQSADPLYHIPTTSYAVINPVDVYGPLETVLREESIDGHQLGDVVFGEIRQYRGGGEVHMDILFDGLSVTLPDRAEPITMGVSSGYDFFGGHAVYVEGLARDSYCANSIRQLTDRETVKHVGEVGDFREWWEATLEQIGLVANDLLAFIEDAGEITIEFPAVPFDVEEFFVLLGVPAYLAARAAEDARAEAADPHEIDMWTLHSGATYALTHFFDGKEGAALDRYVRVANDILFNPEATIETVERAYEEQAAADTEADGQTGLESQVALAQLERVSRDVKAKAAQFERREVTLRERFAAARE